MLTLTYKDSTKTSYASEKLDLRIRFSASRGQEGLELWGMCVEFSLEFC
jgi:hypothetical protein